MTVKSITFLIIWFMHIGDQEYNCWNPFEANCIGVGYDPKNFLYYGNLLLRKLQLAIDWDFKVPLKTNCCSLSKEHISTFKLWFLGLKVTRFQQNLFDVIRSQLHSKYVSATPYCQFPFNLKLFFNVFTWYLVKK